jgi:hypothetical protein
MRNTDHESPYPKPAIEEIRQRGMSEYRKLVQAISERRRIDEGRGRDWSDGLLIERYPVK